MESEIVEKALRFCNHASRVTALTELTNVMLFENAEWDTSGFLGIYDDKLVVTFQGSDSEIDWKKVNFRFWKKVVPYNNTNTDIRVHAGFINAYKAVRNQILNYVLCNRKKEVWCFGHSLGAAMATLAALDIQYNFSDRNIKVVTFGSPRIGNISFEKSYNGRVPNTLRFVNGNDLVTKVPPCIFNYFHIGALKHVGKPYRWWNFWGIADHDLDRYKSNIVQQEQR